MNKTVLKRQSRFWVAVALLLSMASVTYAQKNVLQPSDAIIASSVNHPPSEGVKNAIDGTSAKYLNFDSKQNAKPTGFVVTPSVGVTWVTGISMQSANDAPERDPLEITLEGSNDDTVTDFATGNWELIYKNEAVPAYTARFETKTLTFENFKAFKHYRWTVVKTQTANDCCMQIAEVQILGTTLPKNVLQPSDPIVASSVNHPPSEGVKNAIDGTSAKYLNFDSKQNAKPTGFIVSPTVGATVIQGIVMQSANDAPERDPLEITIEGSNDDTVTDFASGNWSLVYKNAAVPAFAARFESKTILFANYTPYKHYRWTVVKTQTANDCCMQIAEVQLLGSGAPKNVLQPSDAIIASSVNHPPSEGVKNAIDGTSAKYLNFDSKQNAKPTGFVVTPSVGETTISGLFMQSANDAPERDPLEITIEGSNDDAVTDFATGNWELIYKNNAVPAYTARFETQYIYFPNAKAYKHYRWTVVKTQTANDCCMQIAEVGLLAITSQADCTKTAFLLQPQDTPVLLGSKATFFTEVNGPWPLQWYANGQEIAGANKISYTTDAVTADLATNIFTVAIVGCQTSSPVKAVIFTPSATKSIGIQFGGGGANGAGEQGGHKYVLPDDILGVWPQAYWNVATNNSGNTGGVGDQTTMPDALKDSSGANSTITFDYTTSGAWGAGTGLDTPVQRLLNGIAGGTASGTTHTINFANVPAGKHSVLVYCVGPPLQVETVSYAIDTQKYYVKVMNSDDYKPVPGFYLANSTDPKKPTSGNFVRFDNVSPDASGYITLSFENLTGSDREAGVNAIQLVLDAPAVGAPPVIALDPQPTLAADGGAAALTVQATGENLTYQWRKNGRNLPNGGHVSGVTTASLTFNNFSAEDEGIYACAVFSPAGSIVSKNATIFLSKFDVQDALAGYWKFDETTGASAANAVSGQKPAVIKGTGAWGAGKVANALTFNGTDTYAQVDNYTKGVKALSAAAWVKVDPAGTTAMTIARNGEGDLRAPGAGSDVPAGQFELRLTLDATDSLLRLNTRLQAGASFPSVTAPNPFPVGSWTHVAFSADGAQLRLYLNGAEVAEVDYLSDLKKSTVDFLSIGVRQNTNDTGIIVDETANDFMFGQIDELAVWNRPISADEVSKLYAAGNSGKDLTTVVLTPPVVTQPPNLKLERTAGVTLLTFEGTLQSADAIDGTWTDMTATSPYAVPTTTGTQKFYRAKK